MDTTRIVIIGGVAGGASAAARARRLSEDAEIVLIERGEYVSFANCGLPYHIAGVITDRDRLLVQTPQTLWDNLRIRVLTQTEAIHIDPAKREVTLKSLATGEESVMSYTRLILSPGAEPVRLPIAGIDLPGVFTLRSMADMDQIIAHLDGNPASNALVVGGGYIGLEMAEALRHRGLQVTLVEVTPQVMAPVDPEMASPLHQHLREQGVDLRLETGISRLDPDGGRLAATFTTGEQTPYDIVVMATGVRPENRLAKDAGLAIGERGGIKVDSHMRTSDPDIFAVGDAVEVRDYVGGYATLVPLAGPANRQGRIAAENALGRNTEYRDTQGTGICKVFDLSVGMTGINEKTLKRLGRPYAKVYVHPSSHAGYYPGAYPIALKLLYDPRDGHILGAQAVGHDGVDKRIDVLAVAIRANMTVYDLEHLELSYAPPYGSAKDPVNYAGFVAANQLREDVAHWYAEETSTVTDDQLLLDVRTDVEFAAGTIPGAVNIPLQQLRDRLDEVPKDKELLVFCRVGLRGYLASRLLTQHGYRARNLTGGYLTWMMHFPAGLKASSAAFGETQNDSGDAGRTAQPAAPPAAPPPAVDVTPVTEVDARGLQCPGPIMALATAISAVQPGQAVAIRATESAFVTDLDAWCHSTGNILVEKTTGPEGTRAVVMRGGTAPAAASCPASGGSRHKTMVVFSGDFDRVMAAFIIANGAASMGSSVTMFFTFWGINALRQPQPVAVRKNLIERMFGLMMPRGAERLPLSNMHMGGMGLAMIKGIMRKKHVDALNTLIVKAQQAGVKLVVCGMSMDLMGIKREELIDGITEGGVATFLDSAEQGNVTLFV